MVDDTRCPACGADTDAGESFCESCGADLAAGPVVATDPSAPAGPPAEEDGTHLLAPPRMAEDPDTPDTSDAPRGCPVCPGTIDADGYCTRCGTKAESERDHWSERPAPWVGACCDRGIRHARNEDAMAVAAEEAPGSFAALVVCDGVTTAPQSDVASLAAAKAAREALVSARTEDAGGAGGAGRVVHWTEQLVAATLAAQTEAAAVAAGIAPGVDPPSCTFVAVVVDGPTAVAGWVGDSRAYWLPDGEPGIQLSVDDSWATEQVARGMSRELAEADSRCHAITRWLGADAPDAEARCSSVALDHPGWVLVCSDGLWNYASSPSDLRALIDSAVEIDPDPQAIAEHLVAFANQRGGQDNITAALARVPGPGEAPR